MNKIAEYRRKNGVSQGYLALICGWKPSRLSMYETWRRKPGLNDCRKIVIALNKLGIECTLDDIFP